APWKWSSPMAGRCESLQDLMRRPCSSCWTCWRGGHAELPSGRLLRAQKLVDHRLAPRRQTAAVLFSLPSTCPRFGGEPWAYLQDVLGRLPSHPAERLAELLPDEWARAQRAVAAAEPPGEVGAPLSE